MSRLELVTRPLVVFDVDNADHRKWFAEFQRRMSWGHCPVRFTATEEGELVPVIQRQLIQYYAAQEFGCIAA